MSENDPGFNRDRPPVAEEPQRSPAPTSPFAFTVPSNSLSELPDIPPDRPVLIAGPTASGKSALAARLVEDGGGAVVNADALQVYDCWRLLSARPSAAEEAALPHRLYGHVARARPIPRAIG